MRIRLPIQAVDMIMDPPGAEASACSGSASNRPRRRASLGNASKPFVNHCKPQTSKHWRRLLCLRSACSQCICLAGPIVLLLDRHLPGFGCHHGWQPLPAWRRQGSMAQAAQAVRVKKAAGAVRYLWRNAKTNSHEAVAQGRASRTS